jgi:hypothetical protein
MSSIPEALPLNSSPRGARLKTSLTPLRPCWQKGLGDQGLIDPSGCTQEGFVPRVAPLVD